MINPVPAAEPARVHRRPRWGSRVLAAAILFFLLFLGQSVVSNPNVDYHVVVQYLFNIEIMRGLLVTLVLAVLAQLVGVALGAVLAVMRMSDNSVLRSMAGAYIWFFRGTPILVQLLFWYNLSLWFPTISFGVPWGPTFVEVTTTAVMTSFVSAALGLALNEAAYMAEIVRAGILSIDRGQTEAALAMGLTPRRTMTRIVLPQAMRVVIPPTGNEFISMLKTTSLVQVIAGDDLLTKSLNFAHINSQTIEFLIVASVWYLLLTSVATYGQHHLEAYYSRGSSHNGGGPPGPTLRARLRGNLFSLRRAERGAA
ncbi:amino acid ABC transporter permease [Sphaerisporangium flaviroseum]|uniref:Amino acid ABC transporter permease n=1 Tax=Sphaerisporangium flaviroseum TaxID=509199 RepID=A0ABP7I070_9ACTN